MKSTQDQLSQKEKEALALFYGSDTHKALVHIRDIEVTGIGADAIMSESQERTMYLRGQTVWANQLLKLIEDLYNQSQKS